MRSTFRFSVIVVLLACFSLGTVHTFALAEEPETLCDGIDNDDDLLIDEGWPNTDGDGMADCVDPDDDNDGDADGADNCPLVPNASQGDLDDDDIGDKCDPHNVVVVVVEPRKNNQVDFAFPTVHAGILWTPTFDPINIVDKSLCFGDADVPSERACVPIRQRGKSAELNFDGHQDRIYKWTRSESGIDPGDTSACLTGTTKDGIEIEGCGSMTTING